MLTLTLGMPTVPIQLCLPGMACDESDKEKGNLWSDL
jgi:hypothetical protein